MKAWKNNSVDRKRVVIEHTAILTYILLFTFFILYAFNPLKAYANPPKDIELAYDLPAKILHVKITHNSLFPSRHYIKQVVIIKNGQPAATTEYQSQPDKETFTYTYPIPANEKDTLEVTATCSIFGSLSKKIMVIDTSKAR